MSDIDIAVPSPGSDASGAPSLLELVRRQAWYRVDDPAVVDLTTPEPRTVTYGELVSRADSLARRLGSQGVGPEETVAVLLDRSVDSVIAMLAVLAAGGAYCPLDIGAPTARAASLVRALGARVVIADPVAVAGLSTTAAILDPSAVPWAEGASTERGLDLAGTAAPASGEPLEPFDGLRGLEPDPSSLAYVLFTSGSTGLPKGIGMPHRGLSRLVHWQSADGPAGLRTLQFTATSFDVTFQEVLSTLVTGGCLFVVDQETRQDPAALLNVVVSQRIQRIFLPYVALQLLADAAIRRGVVPSSLEHVVTAGERLVVTPAIRQFFTAMPACRFDNHYGPTEAHLVTSHTLPGDPDIWPTAPSIGTPVSGVDCWVLDEQLRVAPEGQVGELHVAGSGLARGYLAQSAQSAERFVAHPYSDVPGERLYRTGDLVRACPDGSYDFVGRADDQLKVRGYRVEPAEVERALLSHPKVAAAAVGLRQLTDGVPALVGYLQTDGPLSPREIGDHVRALLPPYLVPTRFVRVPAMPRTASGKIDGRALAQIELPDASDPQVTGLAQATTRACGDPAGEHDGDAADLVEVLGALWRRVLGHDEFDVDDDFFDVGGDSLLATWVVAELGQALGRPVELSVFLEHSTLEELATALGRDVAASTRPSSHSQVLTLRAGPAGRSLYLVHPLGGELLGYRALARASCAPVRVLGLGWTGAAPPAGSSLEQIAAVHVDQLRTIQPDGPYLLAGWSFGGVLAYEIAQQLTAGGAAVGFLGLVDANPVVDPITGLPLAQTPFLTLLDEVAETLDAVDDGDGAHVDLAGLTSNETWIQLMGAPVAVDTSTAYLRAVLDTARACMSAAMRYRPRPYQGPIDAFQASASGPALQERLSGALRDLAAGPLTIVPVPGDHWGVLRTEHVSQVAAELDAALERAGAAGSGSHGS